MKIYGRLLFLLAFLALAFMGCAGNGIEVGNPSIKNFQGQVLSEPELGQWDYHYNFVSAQQVSIVRVKKVTLPNPSLPFLALPAVPEDAQLVNYQVVDGQVDIFANFPNQSTISLSLALETPSQVQEIQTAVNGQDSALNYQQNLNTAQTNIVGNYPWLVNSCASEKLDLQISQNADELSLQHGFNPGPTSFPLTVDGAGFITFSPTNGKNEALNCSGSVVNGLFSGTCLKPDQTLCFFSYQK